MSEDDAAVLAAQMGRPMEGRQRTISRCHLGLPVVLEVDPDQDGTPFPTLYYLVCPLARIRVSRIEARGGIRELAQELDADPAFAEAFAQSMEDYAAERASRLSPGAPVAARLKGGVGGSRGGIKCLHAHYAHGRAGRSNPVADRIRDQIEPLACERPCVVAGARNPGWREPRE